tara:strand:- start:48 stop:782 length:735 start_codon:yes stop_codon:yes gene_type:complete
MDIVIIKKNGDVAAAKVSNINDIYKKCNYRKNKDFEHYATWDVTVKKKKYCIYMYGKIVGKANMENKYDFPPPIDNELFFGDCALVRIKNDELDSLSVKEWEGIYEKLFGGFENLDDTAMIDLNEKDELKDIPDKYKTKKGGYLKDGFVVEDEDDAIELDAANNKDIDSEISEDDNEDSSDSEDDDSCSDELESDDDVDGSDGDDESDDDNKSEIYYSDEEESLGYTTEEDDAGNNELECEDYV